MYLDRLKRYDPTLKCVITLTEARAVTQAKAADAEIAAGKYRGPLHGIPWGAKDLLAAKGYKTTWGAGPYKEQTIDVDAEVVKRLDAAGAILIAKLTMGELAQGDNWFGGITRNPWWPEQGSSGSSAGPASATAAGCVGFSIGTETQGSISSPSTRCGVSGLRPTFGRVPRTGAMALAWSMDKLGPICRSAEDCALVLNAIYGPDGLDMAVRDIPFNWDATLKPSALRVGYAKAQFDAPERGGDPANPDRITHRLKQHDDEALETLKRIGATLIPVEIPTGGVSSGLILQPEAGAAFEELVRSGHIKEMVQQSANAWPNTFRAASFVPAITYINANRARILMMQKWWELFKNIDVLVIPTGAGGEIQQTNLTGNPSVIIPHGFRESQPLGGGGGGAPVAVRPDSAPPVQQVPRPNTPVSLTFLGPLYQEEKPLALAHAFQKATDFHLKRPPGFTG
jgi:Asp-tRNA(Asn)/Glu-tRNA(Gln) amidotransferase A subunit family amidase